MKRGTIVEAVVPGAYGKPRPALVVQSNQLAGLPSVVICPLTTDLATHGPTRLRLEPTAENGLEHPSLVMIDKLGAIPAGKTRGAIGEIRPDEMNIVDEKLMIVLGLLD